MGRIHGSKIEDRVVERINLTILQRSQEDQELQKSQETYDRSCEAKMNDTIKKVFLFIE